MNALKWKRFACLAVFLLSALFAAAPARGAEGAPKYAEGEALVVLKNSTGQKLKASAFSSGGAGQSRAQSAAKAAQAGAVKTYAALSEASDAILVHMKSGSKTTEELIADLKRNPEVLSAIPNYYNRRFSRTPNDPRYGELWGLKKIRADEAWDTTTGDATVSIAVIDTGIAGHPDLDQNLDRVWVKDFSGEGITDTDGHGTHVSGTIGAVGNNEIGVTGVNWNVKIIPLKVFQGDGAPSDLIVNALDYLVELQKDGKVRVHAVNLSLGGWIPLSPEEMKDSAYYRAHKALDDTNKTVIVVAAGNEGQEVGAPAKYTDIEEGVFQGGYVYPASFTTGLKNMIVVGATDRDDKGAKLSNWSRTAVDIAAPGVGILSTVPGGTYESWQGTSMAAPHVAGAVGLLAARKPSLSASELKTLLLNNADSAVNPPPEKYRPNYSWPGDARLSRCGLLTVKAALDKVSVLPVPVGAISVTPAAAKLTVGETKPFTASVSPSNATDKSVAWSSSEPSVADVDSAGRVRGVSAGSAVITARAQDGSDAAGSATVTVDAGAFVPVEAITVLPSSAQLEFGEERRFIARVLPANATNPAVVWSSSAPSVARVDATGLVSAGTASGTAVITASAQDGSDVSGSAAVAVNELFVPVTDVSITPSAATLRSGSQRRFTAAVYPLNASNQAVVWSSSDPFVAEVDDTGMVYAVGAGEAVIMVTTEEGNFSESARVTVEPASEPPAEPAGPDTAEAEIIGGGSDSGRYSIKVTTQYNEPVPGGITFYIWLRPIPANRAGMTAQADSGLIGPFVALSVKDGNSSRIDFDLNAPKTWNGKSISVPAGDYTLLFADAATKELYVGTVDRVSVKSGASAGGSGGGGCDAGWSLAALAGALLALFLKPGSKGLDS
jgi:uncharacterized protein YjdB